MKHVAWMYDNGDWIAATDQEKVWVESDDFTHDVRMYVEGDFEDLPQKFAYANEIAKRLNTAPRELMDEIEALKHDNEELLKSLAAERTPRELSDDLIEAIVLNYLGDDDELDFIGFARAILKKASEK